MTTAADAIAGLEPGAIERLVQVLEGLQWESGYERYRSALRSRVESEWRDHRRYEDRVERDRVEGLPSLADVILAVRRDLANPNRKLRRSEELWNARDHQAFLAEQAKAEEARQQELIKSSQAAQERFRQAAERDSKLVEKLEAALPRVEPSRPATVAGAVLAARERVFVEAATESDDWVARLCGHGSTTRSGSGSGGRGWMA